MANYKQLAMLLTLLLLSISTNAQHQNQKDSLMVRIAEVEIVTEHLTSYINILKGEAEATVKIEPGVIAVFPMSEEANPNMIRIVEIYANREAYLSHLKTPHFLHYKTATLKMVKSLKLVEMKALDKNAMYQIFKKAH